MPAEAFHTCAYEECGVRFKCAGLVRAESTTPFCACKEQALTGSGLLYYCSFACERLENGPTDSDASDDE